MKREHYYVLALLGLGAVLVLLHLLRGSAAGVGVAQVAGASPDPTAPAYPNAAPIKLGNVTIGGSPTNLTINTVPGADLLPAVKEVSSLGGDCPCEADPCDQVSNLRTVQAVPTSVLESAQKNFLAFEAKLTGLPSVAPMEAVAF